MGFQVFFPLFLMFCMVFKKEKYLKDLKLSSHNAPVILFLASLIISVPRILFVLDHLLHRLSIFSVSNHSYIPSVPWAAGYSDNWHIPILILGLFWAQLHMQKWIYLLVCSSETWHYPEYQTWSPSSHRLSLANSPSLVSLCVHHCVH